MIDRDVHTYLNNKMVDHANYFYASVCHVCKKNSTEVILKVCSSCKLIAYCGQYHQKVHWPQHKQICKCVRSVVNKSGAHHLFDGTEKLNYREWITLRAGYAQLVERMVNRPLNTDEEQLFIFPAVCNICHQYAQPMLPCIECNSVVYCSETHKKHDTTHPENCPKLKICFTVDMYLSYTHYKVPTISSLCSVFDKDEKLPSCMEMFVKEYVKSCSEEDISYFFNSELLCCPLTVIYALQYENLGSKTELNVHVVGADRFEFSVLHMWEILFHWFSKLKYLNLTFIGPEFLEITPELKPKLCSDCALNRTLTVDSQACFYHDYVKDYNFVPNVIVAFNCGFNEYKINPDKDMWKLSIPSFSTFCGIPVILTSYTKEESEEDLLRLLDLKPADKDYRVILACEQNPFASCCPRRDWETLNGVFYANNYVTVVETCTIQYS